VQSTVDHLAKIEAKLDVVLAFSPAPASPAPGTWDTTLWCASDTPLSAEAEEFVPFAYNDELDQAGAPLNVLSFLSGKPLAHTDSDHVGKLSGSLDGKTQRTTAKEGLDIESEDVTKKLPKEFDKQLKTTTAKEGLNIEGEDVKMKPVVTWEDRFAPADERAVPHRGKFDGMKRDIATATPKDGLDSEHEDKAELAASESDITTERMTSHPEWDNFVQYISSVHCDVRYAISLINCKRFIAGESSVHYGIPFDAVSLGSLASSDSGDGDYFDDYFVPAPPLPEPPLRAPPAKKMPGRTASSSGHACSHCGAWPCEKRSLFCSGQL